MTVKLTMLKTKVIVQEATQQYICNLKRQQRQNHVTSCMQTFTELSAVLIKQGCFLSSVMTGSFRQSRCCLGQKTTIHFVS